MTNPINGISHGSIRTDKSMNESKVVQGDFVYDDDQFLQNFGTFAFDAQQKQREEAKKVVGVIWSLVSPLTKGPCSIEDMFAYLALVINNDSERNKNRKTEELMILSRYQAELQKRGSAFADEERLKNEQHAFKAREKNINAEIQQVLRQALQEIQMLVNLTTAQHEAIMNSLRQG
jgi:predicted DNA binding protein